MLNLPAFATMKSEGKLDGIIFISDGYYGFGVSCHYVGGHSWLVLVLDLKNLAINEMMKIFSLA